MKIEDLLKYVFNLPDKIKILVSINLTLYFMIIKKSEINKINLMDR